MSTLADAQARSNIRGRIAKLTPNSQRQWGKMTPHQMVCHLTDGFRMAAGERSPKRIDNFITRTLIRGIALHTPLPWPHGVKTVPEADQTVGGTTPVEWTKDCSTLAGYVDGFGKRGLKTPHPIFGPLSENEWMVWAYRHCDHHLRQFGV